MSFCDQTAPRLSIHRSGALRLWLRTALRFCGPALLSGVLRLWAAPADLGVYEASVRPFLEKHCTSCHGTDSPDAKLDLESLPGDMSQQPAAATWGAVLRKIATGEMPPENKSRPSDADLARVMDWMRRELANAAPETLARHDGGSGNVIEHRLLFDPAFASPFRSPASLRRMGPQQYEGFTKTITIGAGGELAPGLHLPFTPDSRALFSDFGAPEVDEPATGQLLRTALFLVQQQTGFEIREGRFTPMRRSAWVPGTAGSAGVRMPPEFQKLMDESQEIGDADFSAAVAAQFRIVLQRVPSDAELQRFTAFMKKCVEESGRVIGGRYGLMAVLLLPEAVFRMELGSVSGPDGRLRLTGREITFGIARAITDRPPEPWLLADAEKGVLDTREGVEAAIWRILQDSKETTNPATLKGTHVKPPFLRFIREWFGYPRASDVFKDGLDVQGRGLRGNPDHVGSALVEDADLLVTSILEEDRQVLRELLTTRKAFVGMRSHQLAIKQRPLTTARLEKLRVEEPAKYVAKFGDIEPNQLPVLTLYKESDVRSLFQAYGLADFPESQPALLPAGERAGLLTHPAWLVAWSGNSDNHVIFRGKWIRERLLGGQVPEVPITVDAVLPTDATNTLRERMQVTRKEYCWKCHRLMDPLGLPFEQFDHWGRFRSADLGRAVVATGAVKYAGDASIEGEVADPFVLIHRLAQSPHVEQMFVRHAFRFFMGRNEELGDARTLRNAWQAYREHDGSLRHLVASLLSSDTFLFRTPTSAATAGGGAFPRTP